MPRSVGLLDLVLVNQGAEEELDLPRTAARAFCTQWNKLLHFGSVTLSLSFSVRAQPGKLELLRVFKLRGFNERRWVTQMMVKLRSHTGHSEVVWTSGTASLPASRP